MSPASMEASCINLYIFIGVIVGVAVVAAAAIIVTILVSVCLYKKKKNTKRSVSYGNAYELKKS